jgi:hypothetical protein
MATKLRKLKIDRVDLCNKGANQEAHILLFKRDDSEDGGEIHKVAMTLEEILEDRKEKEENQELCWKVTDALMASLNSVADLDDSAERLRVIVTSAKQYVDLMRPMHESLKEESIHMADKPNEVLEALQAKVASLEAINTDLTKKLSEAETSLAKRDEKSVEEDIWKGVPPALKRMFEEQKRETEVAKAAAQFERDERIRRECIAKGEGYQFLPVNPAGDWEVFKAIDNLDDHVSERIYELFRAGDTNLKKAGLPNERGREGGDGAGMSPFEEIQRLVSERMNKSANDMTYDAALSQVMHDRPDLYKSYVNGTMTRVVAEGD